MLKRLSVGAQLRRDVQTVSETAHRAAVLTRQLLAFSRRQLLQPRVVSVNRVVTGVAAMLERLIGEDIVLHLDLAPELGTVRVDPGRLEQVIINLAVNARDAQPRGGTLWIRTENIVIAPDDTSRPHALAAGDYVALTVSDRGCGMDDATLARIFEPFFTTKKPGEGTGLGLSTVYGIVTQSGGHIAVSSERDRGTTFTIHLPRVHEPLDPEVSDSLDNQAGGSETILVVEDDDEVRALARDILEDYGYTVIEARNGEQALEIFNRGTERIALIVTDVVMPELSGPDLAAHFQRHAPGTRIVFISGYPTQLAGPDNVLDAGQSFLSKPFSPRALAEAVRRALDT